MWLSWSSQILLGHVLDLRTQLCTPRRRDGFRSSVWPVHSFCASLWTVLAVCITCYSWDELLFILFRFGGSAFCVSPVFVRGRRVDLLLLWRQSLLHSSFAFALFFHLRYRSAGGLIDWRIFLNLSKMMYRLAFSGSRHFVCLLSFSFVDIVARRLGVSWEQNPKPNGFFVNPKCEARVSL